MKGKQIFNLIPPILPKYSVNLGRERIISCSMGLALDIPGYSGSLTKVEIMADAIKDKEELLQNKD